MIIFIIGTLAIAVLLHFYYMRGYYYWEQRGVPCYRKYHPYTEIFRIILQKAVMYDDIWEAYKGIPGKDVFGICPFKIPQLIVKDPEIIRNIVVKDFDHFVNHMDAFFKDDPLFGKSLFVLKDQKWRDMRNVLTPVFTASKLRGLCELISECGEQTVEHFIQMCEEENGNKILRVDIMDASTRFTNDVIATSAFGIKVNSVIDKNNDFFIAGREITKFSLPRLLLMFFFPSIGKLLKAGLARKSVYDFFINIINETIRTRDEKKIVRPDMIHLLMEARKEQLRVIKEKTAKGEDVAKLSKNVLTNMDIAAQGFVFFLAGYGNVALLMSFTLYELALQPDIQKRLQDEIAEVLKSNNGKLDYDTIKKMKYLDMVVSETLRKWPPLATIDRECTKPYQIVTNNETIDVPKGVAISIPIIGYHYDPKYFPNPNKFDPERFSDENKEKICPYTYMPFGAGPRVCIAVRFVLVETKIFLIHLLSKFDAIVTDKTPIPMVLAAGAVVRPKNGFNLGFKLKN